MKKKKVFLLAGQSNMDGRGDGSQLTAEDLQRLESAQRKVLLAYNGNSPVPLGITPASGSVRNKFKLDQVFGPELFFGIELHQVWPDEDILLIKRSLGGTSLYGCWNANWSHEKASLMGEEGKPRLYQEFIDDTHRMLSGLSPDSYEICGMLWVQGEHDGNVNMFGPKPAEMYGEHLQDLIRSVRKELELPELPFLLLEVSRGKVVEGMQATAAILQNVTFIPQSQDPQAANYLPKYGPPVGHYNYTGMKRIGQMFAEACLKSYA
ncbi:sialate O-acetylesterase [Coraliomargarita parva]|uniref:sialate O-acetylesterase n=1 Tax=Coraliomargarita parva TaxID=3014050 RepID=UPI0022B37D06|nr:sialate O-acetylesterase [Coraliomargarita parva]